MKKAFAAPFLLPVAAAAAGTDDWHHVVVEHDEDWITGMWVDGAIADYTEATSIDQLTDETAWKSKKVDLRTSWTPEEDKRRKNGQP
jgi:hypothetical protein